MVGPLVNHNRSMRLMPRQESKVVSGSDYAALAAGQLHAETANFFKQLRQYLNLSAHQAAALLETHPDVIEALESGALHDLPPWPETHRIASQYTAMAGIDPTPALRYFSQHCNSKARSADAADHGDAAIRQDVAAAPNNRSPWMPHISRLPVMRIVAVAGLLAVLGLGSSGTVIQAATGALPAPVAITVRDAHDAVLTLFSPKFEGMAWINVNDPRTRRSDKLLRTPR